MSNNRKIDVVKLDERSLWKLHEKLKKLQTKENAEIEAGDRKERKSKPTKFQVYQPGITRLSNRKLAANFDKTTVESTEDKTAKNEKASKPKPRSIPKGQSDNNRNSRIRNSGNSAAGRERRSNQSRYNKKDTKRQTLEDEDEQEEGFLARHRRRKKKGESVENFSDDDGEKFEHDDELAWDNYGGSGLVHSGWSPQVTTNETSSQECAGLSDQELYKELSFDAEKPEKQNERPDQQENVEQEDKEVSSDDEPSAATSESNKEYYRVTHSISSQSEDEYDDETKELSEDKQDEDQTFSGTSHPKEKFTEPSVPRSKKQLYDPNNPEEPILVKKSQGQTRGRGQFSVPTSGDNVFKPSMSRERMMSKIKPSQPRRRNSPSYRSPQKSSPPRYYGNYYPDDTQWQEYEPHSPVPRNYHFSTENLSEDEDTVTSQSRSMRQQFRITTLNEAERHEATLTNLLSSPSFDSQEYNESLTRVRNKLKVLYERLIINDIETASNENTEQKLWRNVYYQVIEILREQIRSSPEQDSSDLRDNLVLLLDQGTAFYESLLENLQHKNRFNLKEILSSASARKRHRAKAGKRSKLAIMSCQRVFICLGDIARYREQVNHTSNYGRARHCYLQAQILAPKNGRPYNQLAILAVKTRHKLDAVYYYVRSLAASNPILSARESLMALFDEIRKKVDFMKQKKEEAAGKEMVSLKVVEHQKVNKSRSSVDEGSRRWEEVWILPGTWSEHGEKVQKQQSIEKIPELKLPPPDMAKHFILLFLNIHGKLFTRIGLESFPEISTKMLRIFEATIENPKLLSNHKLLQLYAVNFFAVMNADKLSIHGSAHDSSQNQRRALKLAFSMFAITINQTNKVFESGNPTFDPYASEEFGILLPSIKLMFDWLYANKDCWYPPPQGLTEPDLNIWDSLADLCNCFCNHESTKPRIRIYDEVDEGLHEIFLPEDTQLAGFSPLGQTFSDPRYVENDIITAENKAYVQQCVRISLIRDFLEYLCGMEEPLLAFKQGKYVNVAPTRRSSWSDKSNHDGSYGSSDDLDDYSAPGDENLYLSDQNGPQSNETGELNELKKYRDSLQMTKDLQERRQSQMKMSLESEEKVKLEICPKYLVPDTNCFIDHLDLIEKLVNCGKFKVATPLVVISELEGLATEKKGDHAHAEQVYQSAKSAISFVEKCFSTKNQRFYALTKRGTELQTLRFRSEESQISGNNDDFILQSTHAYAQIHSKSKDHVVSGERVVRRSVVLLTDDRNLRLKALLMQDMATKNIVDFCRWVKI